MWGSLVHTIGSNIIAALLKTSKSKAIESLEEMQQQFPDVHGNAQLNAILATANAEHFKKIKNDEEKYAEMFGLIQQVISVDGMDKVKADAAYAAARDFEQILRGRFNCLVSYLSGTVDALITNEFHVGYGSRCPVPSVSGNTEHNVCR